MTVTYQPAAGAVITIPTLQGSLLHQLGVALYRRHCPDPDNVCARCGGPSPCPARCRAAVVIQAAGDSPGRYDTARPVDEPPGGLPAGAKILSAKAIGYPVGNPDRVRAAGPCTYER